MSLIIHCSFTFSPVCYSYNQTIWRKKRSCTKKPDVPLLRHFSQWFPTVGDPKVFAGRMKYKNPYSMFSDCCGTCLNYFIIEVFTGHSAQMPKLPLLLSTSAPSQQKSSFTGKFVTIGEG